MVRASSSPGASWQHAKYRRVVEPGMSLASWGRGSALSGGGTAKRPGSAQASPARARCGSRGCGRSFLPDVSTALLDVDVKTIERMRLANALWRFVELAV